MRLGWLVEVHLCSLEVKVKAWLFTQGAVGKEKHFEERRTRFELHLERSGWLQGGEQFVREEGQES